MRNALYWLAPLAFLAVAIGVYALVLPACAAWSLLGRYAPVDCRAEAVADDRGLDDALARGRALQAEIDRLERDLLALADCPVVAEAPAELPPDETPPDEPTEAEFDEERWREGDITMMEGCWLLDSDFFGRDTRTGTEHRITDWKICFDAAGNGTQDMRIGDLATCAGPIDARFEGDGTLVLRDRADLPCRGRFRFKYQHETRCRLGTDRRAQCIGKDVRGPASGGEGQPVTLRRE